MSFIEDLKRKRDEIGAHQLATALGLSESTIDVICKGHYKGNLNTITTIFKQLYIDSHICLHSKESIKQSECESRAQNPRPLCGVSIRAWWETCQSCEFNQRKL